MKLIFVSGMYTGGGHYYEIDENIIKAEQVSLKLFPKGWSVFTPHKNTAHYERLECLLGINYETWMKVGIEMLKRCDAIFMMLNWENSPGAIRELKIAEQLGLTIYYEKDGIPNPESCPYGHVGKYIHEEEQG